MKLVRLPDIAKRKRLLARSFPFDACPANGLNGGLLVSGVS
ncbi:hypothetical protein [Mesorhizobium sp.]|nr:hypothetical protein [Mesorhizobium sp.]